MVETIAKERIIETVNRMGSIAIRLPRADGFYATNPFNCLALGHTPQALI
jgi:hypothetical protein